MSAVWEFLKQALIQKAIMTIVLFAACLIATKIILKIFDKFIQRAKIDDLVSKILRFLTSI